MNIYYTRCLLLVCLCAFMPLCAQERWLHIDDLPCEETTSVTQDADGFMWFGTRLALVRYDGYSMKSYRNDMKRPHGFSSCDIRSLCADGSGHVFAGSFFGLNVYSCRSRLVTSRHFKDDDFIGALCVDGQTLWIGTGGGLFRMSPSGHCSRQGGMPVGPILDIARMPGQGVLVTAANGAFRISADGRHCKRLHGTEDISPTAVVVGPGNLVFIGTNGNGLYRYDGKRRQTIDGFRHINIHSLLYSGKQRCLYVGSDKGVMKLGDDGTRAMYLDGKVVADLFEDRMGNIWAATDGEGIWLHHQGSVPLRTEHPSFLRRTCALMSQLDIKHWPDTTLLARHRDINCIYEDPTGRHFIGTIADGVYVYRNNMMERHLAVGQTPWLRHNDCYALATLSSGHMLMASWHGLYLVSPDLRKGRLVTHIGPTDIRNTHILAISRTSDAELWLGLVGALLV